MFNNKTLFKFFFKNNNDKKIQIQQLYVIYLLFRKYNQNVTFNQFYIYVYFFVNSLHTNKIVNIFLGFFFLIKTFKINKINLLADLTDVKQYKNLNYRVHPQNNGVSTFWKKFQKLKRPTTELNYNDYFLVDFKAKLNKYTKIGFLSIFDSFYIVRSKSEFFLKNLVQIKKPLLSIPKYSSSSINKFLTPDAINNFEFQFLRKNKVYNKGRYSRCRQNYRTGVYMCMYLSVVCMFGLYYWFYKFSFNFTYLWWLFISFVASLFIPKIIKYRLYEPITLFSKFFDFFKWISLIIKSILHK
jgi:hypothetical protein